MYSYTANICFLSKLNSATGSKGDNSSKYIKRKLCVICHQCQLVFFRTNSHCVIVHAHTSTKAELFPFISFVGYQRGSFDCFNLTFAKLRYSLITETNHSFKSKQNTFYLLRYQSQTALCVFSSSAC